MVNKYRKTAWILLIIEDVLLLPCVVLSIYRFIEFCGADFQYAIWTRGFLGLTLPIIFLRIFFIPYITAGIILFLLIRSFVIDKQQNIQMNKREVLFYLIASIICILGLLSVEQVFWAGMGV